MLGTQPQPFFRLLDELHQLIDDQHLLLAHQNIVVQHGHTPFGKYQNEMTGFAFLEHSEYYNYIKQADIIITHGGAGSIFDALAEHKKIIALPRLAIFHEHVDNHQQELTKKLFEEEYIISQQFLAESFNMYQTFDFKSYQSKVKEVITSIAEYI